MVTDCIVKIHVHISLHRGSVEPESSGEHVSPVTTTTSSRASLSEFNVTVHLLFSASTRPTGQLEGRGAEVTDSASLRLVDERWLLRLLARAGP